ncbi:MFS transporter [Streptomyces marianii]|uniref:MFS transporter n=1 Tax=Streptomyces marianii TaxID=1817406 RepID=A0A5R9E0X4_9ACTN|nr:MFS transporter [Streptomyces marianii]TLQ41984.1 MFS transporter [Streptomyces marianii]
MNPISTNLRPSLSSRHRRLVLAICCTSLFIIALDNTILQIALPDLQGELNLTVSGLQWTVAAYILVLASLLMLSGSMADRFGRRRVFMTGLAVFTVSSALCSLAPTLTWLIVFRVVQAVGGSMLNPPALALITNTFTERRERARAIGMYSAMGGLALAAGPLVGGLLVDTAGWRSIFWVNVPVGLAALAATRLFVPESRAERARRLDPLGQGLVIALLALLTYTIIHAPEAGWTGLATLTCGAVCLVLVAVLVRHELRCVEPLIEVRFFRSPPFTGAAFSAAATFSTLVGFLFLTSLYLQNVRRLSALQAGLWLLPMAATTLLAAPLSGRFVARHGPRLPLLAGGCAITAGAALFGAFDGQTHTWSMILGCTLFGFGFGSVNAPITTIAVSGMPDSQAGLASSLVSTFRQIGGVLGIAVFGSVLASDLDPLDYASGYVAAARPAWWIIAGCGVAVVATSEFTDRRRPAGIPRQGTVKSSVCSVVGGDGACRHP